MEHPDSEVSHLLMPQATLGALNSNSPSQEPDRWIEAKALLTAAGFDQFTATRWAGQVLALAHRP